MGNTDASGKVDLSQHTSQPHSHMYTHTHTDFVEWLLRKHILTRIEGTAL